MRTNSRLRIITARRKGAALLCVRLLLVFACTAVGLSLVPSSASAEPVKPLTTEQKDKVFSDCSAAGGAFRACCKAASGAYVEETDDDGVVHAYCDTSRVGTRPTPVRGLLAGLSILSSPTSPTGPRGPLAQILSGLLGSPPAPQAPPGPSQQ